MVAKLIIATAILLAAATTLHPEALPLEPQRAGTLEQSSAVTCDCTVLPWKPDPPCPKQCTGLIISGNSVETLSSKLKLSTSVKDAIRDTKNAGATPDKVDQFLETSSGREFIKAVQASNVKDIEALAKTKQQPKH